MFALRSTSRIPSQFKPIPLPRLIISRPYSSSSPTTSKTYEHLLVSTPKPGVALGIFHPPPSLQNQKSRESETNTPIVQLNRPKALNALSSPLISDLNSCLRTLQKDTSVSAIVLTGSNKAFAAGADIKEMKDLTFSTAYGTDFIESWSDLITFLKKPLIAAVNGYALGGGCELAMMADILYCSKSAVFGQPEIKLGIIPGAGGSQRLTHAIGKSRAMEAILTGNNISGTQAGEWGLVARCFETPEECVEGAIQTAEKIAGFSQITVKAAKEVVNKSAEVGLREGLEFERRVFHGLFGSRDQKEGMGAFVEKRKAEFKNE